MRAALLVDSRDLALTLHALLTELDPARWRDDLEAAAGLKREELERQLRRLRARFDSFREQAKRSSLDGALGVMSRRIEEIHDAVTAQANVANETVLSAREQWMEFRARLVPAYDALAASLHVQAVHVPRLRPTNYVRTAVHVAFCVLAVSVLELVPEPLVPWVVVPFLVAGWSMEAIRLTSHRANKVIMKVFAPTAHAHEWSCINSATWYTTALMLLSVLADQASALVALMVLGLGDPAAGEVGRRYGRIALLNGRSLEGTTTLFVVGAVSAGVMLVLFHPGLGLAMIAAMACAGAAFGATAELVCRRIDDNLAIPLAAAAGATLVRVFFS